jgi:hypothetical protein
MLGAYISSHTLYHFPLRFLIGNVLVQTPTSTLDCEIACANVMPNCSYFPTSVRDRIAPHFARQHESLSESDNESLSESDNESLSESDNESLSESDMSRGFFVSVSVLMGFREVKLARSPETHARRNPEFAALFEYAHVIRNKPASITFTYSNLPRQSRHTHVITRTDVQVNLQF